MRYAFIGETPSVIGPVSVDDAVITCPKGSEHNHGESGTVTLYPGDLLDTEIELDSALLDLVETKPETAKQREAREKQDAAAAEAERLAALETDGAPLVVGDTVTLNAAGRDLIGEADTLGDIIVLHPDGAPGVTGPAATVTWATEPESTSTISLALIERATDPDEAPSNPDSEPAAGDTLDDTQGSPS